MSKTRPRPQGCWSHCTYNCISEQMGGCRTTIPTYEMPPPNEGYQHLGSVRFGRREYDEEQLIDPKRWREKIHPADPYALRPICRDPEAVRVDGTGGWRWAYQGVLLWEPELMMRCIYTHPPVVDATWHVARQVDSSGLPEFQLRPLTRELRALYHGRYKTEATALYGGFLAPLHDRILESCKNLTVETHAKKSEKFFELAIDLIARWCVADFYDQQDHWAVVLAEYANLGDQWNEIIEARQQQEASGRKYRFRKRPVNISELSHGREPAAGAIGTTGGPICATATRIKFKRKATGEATGEATGKTAADAGTGTQD